MDILLLKEPQQLNYLKFYYMPFLNDSEIAKIGFKLVGKNVKISTLAQIYGANRISIGDHSRIDDFCVLSAGEYGIEIGAYVHIAVFSSLIGREKITMSDFSGLSSRVSIYSSSDDYSGAALTNPCVPEKFTNVDHRPVCLGRHVIIGVGSTVLPGVTIGDGTAVGAYSLVSKNLPNNVIAIGVPAKPIKDRKRTIYDLELELVKSLEHL